MRMGNNWDGKTSLGRETITGMGKHHGGGKPSQAWETIVGDGKPSLGWEIMEMGTHCVVKNPTIVVATGTDTRALFASNKPHLAPCHGSCSSSSPSSRCSCPPDGSVPQYLTLHRSFLPPTQRVPLWLLMASEVPPRPPPHGSALGAGTPRAPHSAQQHPEPSGGVPALAGDNLQVQDQPSFTMDVTNVHNVLTWLDTIPNVPDSLTFLKQLPVFLEHGVEGNCPEERVAAGTLWDSWGW